MRDLQLEFKNREVDYAKLVKNGFYKVGKDFLFRTKICEEQFEMIVSISEKQKNAQLIDLMSGDEYVLVDIQEATGEFVGKVRAEYEEKLQEIIQKCTKKSTFQMPQAKEIIDYVSEKYHSELEFLWEKFDNNAIWRNSANQKWYGLILTLTADKLGLPTKDILEVLVLRYQKEKIQKIVDGNLIFPGYHMNKSSWITVKLDGSVSSEKIFELMDNSFNLSNGARYTIAQSELAKKVFEYLTIIPKGKVVTYGQVAKYLGNRGLARVVGNILHKNPDGDKYPCYKVLNSKGELSEAFVFGGKHVQEERLKKDGIEVVDGKVDLKIYQWEE